MSGNSKERIRENCLSPEAKQGRDYSWYPYRPILIEAEKAHREGIVVYDKDGMVTFRHPDLSQFTQETEIQIPPSRQFPTIFNSFMALNNALSRLATSPLLEGEKSLRQKFDEEFTRYRDLVNQQTADQWEPDYGAYVFDHIEGRLYLILPKFWHRLGLVTSNSKLLTDPEGKLSWREIREKLENTVVGFAGVSVGGNILEGWLREARPKQVKTADPDFWEITNLNRGERMSIRHLAGARAQRQNPQNPYETVFVNKAEATAYEQHLVDPYAEIFVYSEGINESNLKQFLLGNGQNEPPISIFVEETDDFPTKMWTREGCRASNIPVSMMSDFGYSTERLFQDFGRQPELELGHKASDAELQALLDRVMTAGKKEDILAFIQALCGSSLVKREDEVGQWARGEGEQPTSSLPQPGATAMAAGGIGGLTLALYVLGYEIEPRKIFNLRPEKVIYG